MSKISDKIKVYAEEEKRAHQEYITDYTASAVSHLVQGGVGRDQAVLLSKEACLRDEELVKSITRSIILEKTAEYIEALELKNSELEAKISIARPDSNEKQAEIPEHLQKLAELGFTSEELTALQDVPKELVEKVAGMPDTAWEMGKPVGPSVAQDDPLLSWILSR